MATARHMICDVLVDAGIDHVFGMPGGGVIPIFDALYDRQDKIRTVLVRHEQSAACMADMYGRLTGKPEVVLCQGLWADCNAAFGIMEAYLASTPMVVITDTSDFNVFAQHGVYQCASGEYGSVDLREVFKGMSKFVSYATTGAEAVQGLQLAIKHATTGRMGPACLIIKSAAVGAKFVYPQRPVVCIAGDGGFAMTNNAVSTAVEYGLPVVFVVLNNSVLGFVRDFQPGRPMASEFVATDFARIGEGWGAVGRRIEDPEHVRPAIEEALKESRPTVLDIITEAAPVFEVASL